MSLIETIRAKVCREEWNLGIVAQTAQNIIRNGITEPVRWLPPIGPWLMLADPCVHTLDGQPMVFAEYLDYWNGKGEIWAAPFKEHGLTLADFRPFLDEPVHLSFPFLFSHSGFDYMMVETWEANGLYLYRRRRLPGEPERFQWDVDRKLLAGPVVDAAIFYQKEDRRWWLFCGFQDKSPNENLFLFYADSPEGPWEPHRHNPVKSDPRSSRPAGPLFTTGPGDYIMRPAQDCTLTYGGGVAINYVSCLHPSCFEERIVRLLEPLPGPYPNGLHTFCPAGNYTIIDGKRWGFRPSDVVRRAKQFGSSRRRCTSFARLHSREGMT